MAPPDYKYFQLQDLFKETENQYVQTIGKYLTTSKLQLLELREVEHEQNIGLNFTKSDCIPAKVTYLHVLGELICSKKMIMVNLYSELPSEYSAKTRIRLFKKIFNIHDPDEIQKTMTLRLQNRKCKDVEMFRKAEQMLLEVKREDREARAKAEAQELNRKRNTEEFEDSGRDPGQALLESKSEAENSDEAYISFKENAEGSGEKRKCIENSMWRVVKEDEDV